MLNTIGKIVIVLLFSFSAFAKRPEENYRLVSPKFIPQNSTFEISLVTSNKFHQADHLELYIIPESGLNLSRIDLKSVFENTRLYFSSSYLEALNTSAFKTEINLSNGSLYQQGFFQVLFTFRSDNNLSSNVRFYGVYKNKDRVIGYLSDSPDNMIQSNLKFFKSQKNAGRAIQISKESQFDFSLPDVDAKNLLAEFWIKLNDPDISILKIFNRKNPASDIELSINEFQMLSVNSSEYFEYISPYFTSKKVWYHISVHFSGDKKKISFYCNSVLFARYAVENLITVKDLNFKFYVNEQGRSYQLDLLRFIDFNNSLETAFANRSFANFKADSSYVIAQYKFDSGDEFNGGQKLTVITDNLQYVKSDAPILARAPELNILLMNSSYELEWGGGDYKQAASYVLEKSAGSSDYLPVFTIQADKENEKNYSYVDKQDGASEIVYYRVKQVNEDGSFVYSSSVKVGQGKMELFTLRQNYPNPFNPKTSIDIELLEDTEAEITIYNLEGQEIRKLHKGVLPKGLHKFEFDATDLPSGVYLYKVSTPGFSQTKKMILTK